jgi:hypothetical protein
MNKKQAGALTSGKEKKQSKSINIKRQDGDKRSEAELKAEFFLLCGANAAVVLSDYSENRYGEDIGFSEWFAGVISMLDNADGKGMKKLESMLASQAIALDAVFTGYARRSKSNAEAGYGDAAERYMRLALKAQNQCRTTIDTLSTIKNPRPTLITKQANIAHGPQQVNNNFNQQPQALDGDEQGCEPSSPKNFKTEQNELLNANEEIDRLDTRAARPSSRDDQKMETVGEVNRPKNRVRQGNRSKEL